jgi:hypothetical protein
MDRTDLEGSAFAKTTAFRFYFKDMPDSRQRGEIAYPLDEIFLLRLVAVLAGAEAFTDIARFGEKKLDLLRRFRPYANGTPAHDHLGDIFATPDASASNLQKRRQSSRPLATFETRCRCACNEFPDGLHDLFRSAIPSTDTKGSMA